MSRLRWHHCKKGRLHVPGAPPHPDPKNGNRLIAGRAPCLLKFKMDGDDGVCDVDDPAVLAAVQKTLPWTRGMLRLDGDMQALVAAVSVPDVPDALSHVVPLSGPLPYFAEPEPFESVLRWYVP